MTFCSRDQKFTLPWVVMCLSFLLQLQHHLISFSFVAFCSRFSVEIGVCRSCSSSSILVYLINFLERNFGLIKFNWTYLHWNFFLYFSFLNSLLPLRCGVSLWTLIWIQIFLMVLSPLMVCYSVSASTKATKSEI